MTAHALIFTRYPQAGRSKTRLIPALGAAGAATTQRAMTEHVLQQVVQSGMLVHICYADSDDQAPLQDWLGAQHHYLAQKGADLGDRLIHAFTTVHSQQPAGAIYAIGADVPSITPHILLQAQQALEHHDVVLGPAYDGGYYLIGMKKPYPALFQDIAWGTSTVANSTRQRCQQQKLSLAELTTLHDIDEPDDLAIWYRIRDHAHA